MSKVNITLKRSLVGANKNQIKTVHALGLRKIGQCVQHEDNAAIRGMIKRVEHMLTWEEA